MKATPVNAILRHGAFALALLGGAAITAAPASANSVDNEGCFGGSWSSIGPLYGNRVYVAPSYAYARPTTDRPMTTITLPGRA
jgi:hypothetical protein